MMEARAIAEIELPALVRVRGAWFYLLATHGELILDYAGYDPTYDPAAWEDSFRGDLLTVLPSDGFRFLDALSASVYPIGVIRDFVRLNGERAQPVAVVDFDTARFVSSFYDQALETLCGGSWNADFGEPLDEVPERMADMFRSDG